MTPADADQTTRGKEATDSRGGRIWNGPLGVIAALLGVIVVFDLAKGSVQDAGILGGMALEVIDPRGTEVEMLGA